LAFLPKYKFGVSAGVVGCCMVIGGEGEAPSMKEDVSEPTYPFVSFPLGEPECELGMGGSTVVSRQ
jgi:hypothetical protein